MKNARKVSDFHHCEAKVYTVAQKQEIHCSEFDANITNNEILKGWMVC